MTALITPDLVRLDVALGDDSPAVIRALAGVVQSSGRATDEAQLVEDALARENTSRTGLPGGIAIPHCRSAGVEEPTLAFARLSPAVDFGAKDGPADLAFLIAAPAGGDTTHLQLLTKLARALVKPAFTNALREAGSPQEVVDLISHEVGQVPVPVPAAAAGAAPDPSPLPLRSRRPRPYPEARGGWSGSPPAQPVSPTPTWPPRRSRQQRNGQVWRSRSRPRGRPGQPRWGRTRSLPPRP